MSTLKEKVEQAKYCVAFTGAGISTFSGIQDFRGKNGMYKHMDAEKIFSLDYFKQNPTHFYNHAKDLFYDLKKREPGIVHKTLANLEQKGIIKSIITQNIDMLQQKAGSKKVIEIHGSPLIHQCLSCQKEFALELVITMMQTKTVPRCDVCEGLLKPGVTLFGEPLPIEAFQEAFHEAYKADLLFVLGSSLVVQPAASIPLRVIQSGGEIIIVNNQNTPLDHLAILHFNSLEEFCNHISEYF